MQQVNYIDLDSVYPKGELNSQTYKIDRIILSEEDVKMAKFRNTMDGQSWLSRGLKSDFPYVRLYKKGDGIMMSDTPMERNTNESFIHKANGDVLIFGLGLGLVILPLLKKENVRSILVVELYQDLIDVILPILKESDSENKLSVIQGDCFEIHNVIDKQRKFDCVYGDIWIDINTDNYEEMKTLTKNWKSRINRSNPDSFIDHWLKDYLKKELAKDKKRMDFLNGIRW